MDMAGPDASLRDVQAPTAQRVAELLEVFDTIVESSAGDHLHDIDNAFGATVAFDRAHLSSIVDHARAQLAEIHETLDRLRRC